ncbi:MULTISPECIES: ABC transporter permease [Limnochorda]|uniref:ABC transporter permease n=1 Tax=Limnochorda TaxID=1676651 RepID=UPI001848C884|nr:ABC transporter permease [Limnochorda pilosa]MBO2486453.1 nodulation protein NodJ [Bacillota bacterium]MBO2520065.1 nodulation protein NodJ [Bacillota bacterium]NMA70440.1 ABC transporter permease [Bacillota bacterium]
MSVEIPSDLPQGRARSAPRRAALVWPHFNARSLTVWRRNALAWRRHAASSILANLMDPVLSLLALGLGLGLFVSRIGEYSFLEFIGPGLLAGSAMTWITYDLTYGCYDRLHWSRAYHAMIASPLSVGEIVAGEFAWQATRTTLFGLGFLALMAPFGIVHSPWAVPGTVVITLLTALIFTGPALAVGAAARAEEQLSYYFNLVITPMFFFSGVFFPLESLGPALRQVAQFLPLYHLVELARAFILGSPLPNLTTHLLWLGLFILISFLLPGRLLRDALERIA